MKKILFLLVLMFGTAFPGLAQTANSPAASDLHTPRPTYPLDARKAQMAGSGTCQVVFNASGHIASAEMTKSTGWKILDENTVDFARKNWTGRPNTKAAVPIVYRIVTTPKQAVRVWVSSPPHPYQARASHSQGRGIVKVTFDESGRAVSATMAKSTGSDILDSNTVNYVLKEWKSSGRERTTIAVPVAYSLR